MQKYLLSFILGLFIFSSGYSQKKKENKEEEIKWDVSNPGKDFHYKSHSFTTDEGTWMNLDISPNGQTIVFETQHR